MIDASDLSKITSYLPAPSRISHHGQSCCTRALSWLIAIDRANSFSAGSFEPPAWLRRSYGWAPHAWPIHWCELPMVNDLDCGALAALAIEVFRARGTAAHPVQLALRYPTYALSVWRDTWTASVGHSAWVGSNVCYHEACAVIQSDEVQIWDPTECRWLTHWQVSGSGVDQRQGQLLAMRIFDEQVTPSLRFAGHTLRPSGWTYFI